VDRFPEYDQGLGHLGHVLHVYGNHLANMMRLAEAEAHYRRSLSIQVRSAAKSQGSLGANDDPWVLGLSIQVRGAAKSQGLAPRFYEQLSDTCNRLDSILTASGRGNQIDRVYGDALTLSESPGHVSIDIRPILQGRWALSLVTRPDVQSRDLPRALELARRAVELTSQSDAGAWFTLGSILAQAGDQRGLDEAFRGRIALAGDNAVKMGRWWDLAVTALTRALELKVDSTQLRMARGRAFARLGQTQQAEADFTEVVKMAEKGMVNGHEQRLLAGDLQREPGQLPRAEAMFRVAVKTWEQLVTEQPRDDHSLHWVADTHFRLAMVLNARGQRDAALAEFREAIRLHEEHLVRVPDPTYGEGLRALAYFEYGRLLSQVGRVEEAWALYDEAEPWVRKSMAASAASGLVPKHYASALASLGLSLLERRKWTDAELVLRECLALREKQEPDAWTTFNATSMLGGALNGQKKRAEAEPLLVQGYEGMKQRAAKIPIADKPHLAEALERLVQLYDAWGKPDQAARWRRELESEKAAAKPPDP
jgi:tetratricopeptide (TPR) repeat protein